MVTYEEAALLWYAEISSSLDQLRIAFIASSVFTAFLLSAVVFYVLWGRRW